MADRRVTWATSLPHGVVTYWLVGYGCVMVFLTSTSRSRLRGALRPAGDALARMAEAVASPLVPADYLDLVAPLRATADLRARVVAVTAETRDAATVPSSPAASWRGHDAGQYVRLGVDVDGVRHWRAYSLTCPSSAAGRRRLSVTVKAIPDGQGQQPPGAARSVRHARAARPGHRRLRPRRRHRGQSLFVTAGSGITPVMGMLRNHCTSSDDVVVVHSAPTPTTSSSAASCACWPRPGRIRLVERHTDADGMLERRRRSTTSSPDSPTARRGRAVPPACSTRSRRTGRPRVWPIDCTPSGSGPSSSPRRDGGAVTFTRSGTVVEASGAETLLDAGEAAGVLMPSGCRMGICFGCVLPAAPGRRSRPAHRRRHHRRPRGRRPDPDLRVRRRRPLRHRSLTSTERRGDRP